MMEFKNGWLLISTVDFNKDDESFAVMVQISQIKMLLFKANRNSRRDLLQVKSINCDFDFIITGNQEK